MLSGIGDAILVEMTATQWVLSVDIGATRTAVAHSAAEADSATELVAIGRDGHRWAPSTIAVDQDGTISWGHSAADMRIEAPEQIESAITRHLGAPVPVLLGPHVVHPDDAIGVIIDAVLEQAKAHHQDTDPAAIVVTHPGSWGQERVDALIAAARRPGIARVYAADQSIAAATHYVAAYPDSFAAAGDTATVVVDWGGTRLEVVALQHGEHGFEPIGPPSSSDHFAGDQIDHAVYLFLGQCVADDDPELWKQIQFGDEPQWRQAAADLRAAAQRAKEAVSAYPSTEVHLPLLDRNIVFSRAQLEDMIRSDLNEAVESIAATISGAGIDVDALGAIVLTGGTSRIPLIAQLLQRRFNILVLIDDEPKAAVALGGVRLGRQRLDDDDPEPTTMGPTTAAPTPRHDQLWQLRFHAPLRTVTAVSDGVIAIDEADHVHFARANGQWQWSARLPGPSWGPPVMVAGHVVAGCSNRQLGIYRADNGQPLSPWATSAPIVVGLATGSDLILAVGEDQRLSAYGTDGMVRWILPIASPMPSVPAIAGDTGLLGCANGHVYRFDIHTGVVTWAFPARSAVSSTPAIAGQHAIVSSVDGMVYSVDLMTGHAAWGTQIDHAISGPVAVYRDRALVMDHGGTLTMLALNSGERLGAVTVGGAGTTGVVVAGAWAHIDTGDGHLLSVHIDSETVVAASPLGGGAWLPPAPMPGFVVVRDGSVVRALRIPH